MTKNSLFPRQPEVRDLASFRYHASGVWPPGKAESWEERWQGGVSHVARDESSPPVPLLAPWLCGEVSKVSSPHVKWAESWALCLNDAGQLRQLVRGPPG